MIRGFQKQHSLKPERIRGLCADVHFNLSAFFDFEGLPHILTIGDVIYKGEPEWYTDADYLRDEFDGKYQPGDPLRAHAWITLPDLSIMDATYWFRLHRAELPKKFSWEDRIICEQPTRQDVRYVPYLVGNRFLKRILRVG